VSGDFRIFSNVLGCVEFGEFFPDEQACVAYLERLRWPEGFVCPRGHVGRGRQSQRKANRNRWESDEGSE